MEYCFVPVALYIICSIGFCLCSQNMDASDYRTGFWQLFQPCLLFILFLHLTKSATAGSPAGLLACATGIITGFAFPLLFHLTHQGEPKSYSYPVDFTFGLCCSVLLVSLADVLLYGNPAVCAVLLTVTEILVLLPAFFQLSYFGYYRECVNELAVKALFNTNKLEVREYIRLLPKSVLCMVTGGFLVTAAVMFQINRTFASVNAYPAFPTTSFLFFY